MDAINIRMTLTERDGYLNKIEQQIKEKEQYLLNKYKQIGVLAKENEFLESVKDDYTNYYNYIVQEKQAQINAMEKINAHINSLVLNTQLSADKIKDAKIEQQRILNEMNNIKQNLDYLITIK